SPHSNIAAPFLSLESSAGSVSSLLSSGFIIPFSLKTGVILKMKRVTRRSSIGVQKNLNKTGNNFSTRFSLPSFVKRVEKLSEQQRNAIKETGFGNLLLMPNQMLIKNLLFELMERWSCEARAFLLLPGKGGITITLLDVAVILGLRVVGEPVVLGEDEPFSELEREYGAVLWKRKISIASIEERLDSLGEIANEDFIRNFLLFTIGTLLFPNASGKVDSRYLSFLKNLDGVCSFAWGSAVLEDMITWLNRRKEMNIQYMGGCLIFLQLWSYEHIDIARPSLVDCCSTFPRACQWENNRSHHKQWFSVKFKELQDHQIIWKLQLTSAELEVDIIKELLKAQNDKEELLRPQVCSSSCSIVSIVEVESNTDMEISNEVDEIQEVILEPLTILQPEVQRDALDYPSTSCMPELHKENMEPAPQTQDSRSNFDTGNEDDLRTRNRILEEQIMELKKDIDKLSCENISLKGKLMSSPLSEEQDVELKKEVERLRRENRLLSWSTENLVRRLEKHLLNEDIDGTEAISV
ncbi:PMD domain-containing protein, partial [Cephalotus follicularis]